MELSAASFARDDVFSTSNCYGPGSIHQRQSLPHERPIISAGMASPTAEVALEPSIEGDDTDYGSDFSLEDVNRLLSPPQVEEDNPIVNDIEDYYDAQETLRIPRILGREGKSPSTKEAEITKDIPFAEQGGEYSDCKSFNLNK